MRWAQFETVPPPAALGPNRRNSYLNITAGSLHLEPAPYLEDA